MPESQPENQYEAQENDTAQNPTPRLPEETPPPQPVRPSRRMDVFSLVAGVITLLVSVYILTDSASWLPPFDLRWVLAGGAVLVGILMLGASLRRRA